MHFLRFFKYAGSYLCSSLCLDALPPLQGYILLMSDSQPKCHLLRKASRTPSLSSCQPPGPLSCCPKDVASQCSLPSGCLVCSFSCLVPVSPQLECRLCRARSSSPLCPLGLAPGLACSRSSTVCVEGMNAFNGEKLGSQEWLFKGADI